MITKCHQSWIRFPVTSAFPITIYHNTKSNTRLSLVRYTVEELFFGIPPGWPLGTTHELIKLGKVCSSWASNTRLRMATYSQQCTSVDWSQITWGNFMSWNAACQEPWPKKLKTLMVNLNIPMSMYVLTYVWRYACIWCEWCMWIYIYIHNIVISLCV